MKLMAHRDNLRFQCYLTEGIEDAEAVARTFWMRHDIAYADITAAEQESSIEAAETLLEEGLDQYFVLWDGEKKRVIGKTCICHLIVFTDSYITPEARRLGLADLLYEGRMRYLQENSFHKLIFTNITKSNKASREAATRNGFKENILTKFFMTSNYFRTIPKLIPNTDLELSRDLVFKDPKPRLENP